MSVHLTLLPDGTRVVAEYGDLLIDLIDAHPALSIPLACRSARCGSCLVRVQRGADRLAPADAWEQETLAKLSETPGARLGCALVITNESGEVVLVRLAPD